MSNEELLPCPFCGGEAIVKHIDSRDDWWVWCRGCNIQRPSVKNIVHTRDEAIASWNRRTFAMPEEIRADVWHLISTVSIVHHRKAVEYADSDAVIAAGHVQKWLKQLDRTAK